MVFTYPTDAKAEWAIRIDQETSLMGRRLYASMAAFESKRRRRSPRLIMLAILSNRKTRGIIAVAEFTRPLKDVPSNVERLLEQVGVGHV
jgi:hypothetical protein